MIRQVNYCHDEDMLKIFTNAGNITFKKAGIFNIIPIKIFYNEKNLGTILSVKDVLNLKVETIKMDSAKK